MPLAQSHVGNKYIVRFHLEIHLHPVRHLRVEENWLYHNPVSADQA